MPAKIIRTVALFVALALTALGAFTLGQHWGTTITAPIGDMLRVGVAVIALTIAWGMSVATAAGWKAPLRGATA